MFRIFFLALLLSFDSLAGSTCQYQLGSSCLRLEFKTPEDIRRNKDNEFTISTVSEKAMPGVKIHLWMKMVNGHEHGSEKVEQVKSKSSVAVSNVWFLMLGQWEVHIRDKANKVIIPVCIKKGATKSFVGKCSRGK